MTMPNFVRLPPRWFRRIVLAPLIVAIAFVWLPMAAWLVVVVAGVVALALPGRMRILRVIFMLGLYLLWDATALVWMFALWVASGFGWAIRRPWFERRHYALARVMLRSLFGAAKWVLRLDIVVQDDEMTVLSEPVPVIVASRHAGPADSFIIVDALLSHFRREPAIVLKDTLQWDPAVDVLLNRLPARFITPARFDSPGGKRRKRSGGGASAISDLASGLDDNDALLIFPEGGNLTERRRLRRIEQLRAAGNTEFADRAEALTHLMPPHAGGILSAMKASPEAGVVLLAHTGLERLATIYDIWRELPVDKRITLKGWTADPATIPADLADREHWLYDWWEHIDAWIEANQPTTSAAAQRAVR